ncbi:MAG TPA: DUF4393 domain-containing protein [Candidatus Babeliaceae bacterium]|nr:DUF4393 domain-containing protein [Candidatus Babeliaceae bacterium]
MNEETSNPDSNIKSTIDAVTGLAKAIPVYQDAIQPSAKQIGKSLETVTKTVNIALAPIKALVWGYEQIEQFVTNKIAEKLRKLPPENIVTPSLQIAGPAFEALRYAGHDDNLRELFANLLATSMDKDTIHKAHPAYVEIIKNLCPDEAILLNAVIKENTYPMIKIQAHNKNIMMGYQEMHPMYTHLDEIAPIKRRDFIPTYINNLCRLGILEALSDIYIIDPNIYEPLENDEKLNDLKKLIERTDRNVIFKRGIIRTTPFGLQFVNNVVIEK